MVDTVEPGEVRYEYALCEDGYIRCANCEAIKGDAHEQGCTGGSVLVTVAPAAALQGE